MPEPVKTLLLKVIEQALKDILNEDTTTAFTVVRNPFQVKTIETAKFPIIFIFDETEDKKPRNRLADCYLPIHIELWVKAHEDAQDDEPSLLDQADLYAAQIEYRLVNVRRFYPGLEWIKQIIPRPGVSITKFLQDEFLGGAILLYDTFYLHEWGNPFNAMRNP